MAEAKENIRGALIMMGSMAAFTFNDTFFKTVAGDVPLFQAIFIRGCMVSLVLFLYVSVQGQLRPPIERRDWRLLGVRSIGEVGATLAFLVALFNAPIANVTAMLQAAPLVLTLAGALLLGEKVGWRRYTAIAVGFFGVLLIVQPTGSGFNPYTLYALIALAFMLFRDLPTRRLSTKVPSVFVALLASVSITVTGAVGLIFEEWVPLTIQNLKAIGGASAFLVFAYILAVSVMRVGDMAVVQPFRYTGILWAILLGMLVFGEIPNRLMLIGATIVVAMGIYTFYREGKMRRT
jgi:drug/metabolite transporter (DMT)-like permease